MRYAKAGVALVVVVASYVVARLTGGSLDPTEWSNVVLAGLTTAAVFTGPNVPHSPVTKSAIASHGALFTAVNNVIAPGTSMPGWWQLVVAVAGALAVYFVPNKAAVGAS